MTETKRNLAASAHQRLLNHSVAHKQDFQVVLTQYAFERLLHRLEHSPHSGDFVLKGALLFLVWSGEQYRPTRDMDLASKKIRTNEELRSIFCNICEVVVDDDGLVFHKNSVNVEPIRDDNEYGGMRATLLVTLGQARIPVQIDIGFADAITPAAVVQTFPALLDGPPPHISMYPPETAIAEKVHTLTVRGILNSRMKDYYDIWALSQTFEFEGAVLSRAIAATFQRRKTAIPDAIPIGLSDEFSADTAKKKQWTAFVRRMHLNVTECDLKSVVSIMRSFLMPPCLSAAAGQDFCQRWKKTGPWIPESAST